MMAGFPQRIIRGLLFSSPEGVSLEELCRVLERSGNAVDPQKLEVWLRQESDRSKNEQDAWELHCLAQKWVYLTAPDLAQYIRELELDRSQRGLSQAAIETLAVIAYKQPVTKTDVEQIRGVNCDYSVQKLLERGLISVLGKKEGPGKPLIYGTSQAFLDHFGLKGPEDLPPLKEIQEKEENSTSLAD